MGFLDNLENTLKAAEAAEERDPAAIFRSRQQAEAERNKARSLQPLADELKRGKFTAELLNETIRISHGLRTKVYITWIGQTLRLDAREHRLELTPTVEGVVAAATNAGQPTLREVVDLQQSAKPLAEKWLAIVGPRPEPKPAAHE